MPPQPGTYEQFAAQQLAGPRYIPEATFVALEGELVVGYGKLSWINRSAGIADHDMLELPLHADARRTRVPRPLRSRGVTH